MGFGTGLNVLVTLQKFLQSTDLRINYYSLEKYPISQEEAQNLDYGKLFENPVIKEIYTEIHSCEWEKQVEIQPNFFLKKIKTDFLNWIK